MALEHGPPKDTLRKLTKPARFYKTLGLRCRPTTMGSSRRIHKNMGARCVFLHGGRTPFQIDKTGAISQDAFLTCGVPSAHK
jgi:hypothetical protein